MHAAGAAQPGSKNEPESVGGQREYLGGEPERCRSGTGPRALQRDLPEVEFVAGEVGVRGFVRIVGADTGMSKQNRPAAVRLKPVLVWINDH